MKQKEYILFDVVIYLIVVLGIYDIRHMCQVLICSRSFLLA